MSKKPLGVQGPRDLSVPLWLGPSGFFGLAEEEESISQNLQAICSVDTGERLMRPDIGIPISRLIFEPATIVTQAVLATFIRGQIDLFEKRIDVLRLSTRVEVGEETGSSKTCALIVTVFWRIKKNGSTGRTTVRSIYS
jgi:phage baseplate assembly protein W